MAFGNSLILLDHQLLIILVMYSEKANWIKVLLSKNSTEVLAMLQDTLFTTRMTAESLIKKDDTVWVDCE